MVNDAEITVAKEMKHAAFVSSDGLVSKSDNLHFDAPSQREFGIRHAAAYLKTQQAQPASNAVDGVPPAGTSGCRKSF